MSDHDLECATCDHHSCRAGTACTDDAQEVLAAYRDEELARLHRAASAIEARHYRRQTRLGEIVLFARELGVRRIGLAFCVGLADEARVIAEVLDRHFEVLSACCKIGGVAKDELGLEKIDPTADEVMCSPVEQARLLNEAGAELNVICGLCVGHDAIFAKTSEAPVTTLVAKDRVLAHNPIGAVYCPYVRRGLEEL